MFNPDDVKVAPTTDAEYVASGTTSICYKQRYYGKWLIKKQLREEFTSDTRMRLAFRKEFELGFQLEHPNIVRYIDIHDEPEELYIHTDYVDGSSLDTLIHTQCDFLHQHSWQKQFVTELFSAIDYLHQRQILHLDLKPENIMITNIGHHVKLIDLGFSYQDCFTQSCGGSLLYSSPELFEQKGRLSQASDIYSIGQIFQEMHLGSKKVIEKCLELDASKRYQSISELKNAFYSAKSRIIIYSILFILLTCIAVGFAFNIFPSKASETNIANNISLKILDSSSTPVIVSLRLKEEIDVSLIKQWGILYGMEKGQTIRNSREVDWDNGNPKDIGLRKPTNENAKVTFPGDNLSDMNLRLMHLLENHIYYLRPFVILNNSKILYGKNVHFKTASFSRSPILFDFANVYWNSKHDLFDLQSDEIIRPDTKGYYTVYLSSNEDYRHYILLHCRAHELPRYHYYKFKSFKNYKEWSNWHANN